MNSQNINKGAGAFSLVFGFYLLIISAFLFFLSGELAIESIVLGFILIGLGWSISKDVSSSPKAKLIAVACIGFLLIVLKFIESTKAGSSSFGSLVFPIILTGSALLALNDINKLNSKHIKEKSKAPLSFKGKIADLGKAVLIGLAIIVIPILIGYFYSILTK